MAINSVEHDNINWLDNIPLSILLSDNYGNCTHTNKCWLEYTGNALEEEKGIGWKSTIHPEDRKHCQKKLASAIDEQKEYSLRLRLKSKKEEYHWFENAGKPLFDNTRKYVGHISTFTAIPEQEIDLLKGLLKEKELLLHEIIHRTKNCMAVISGLFDLHIDYIENLNDQAIFETFQHRIISIALIHENIYQSDTLSKMNFKFFVEEITKKITNTYKENKDTVSIKIEVDNIELELAKAMPCGLIVNELITNVFKHAFKPTSVGELTIGFSKTSEKYRLIVSDNGIGITDEDVTRFPNTLGYTLINALVRQLNGVMEINNREGLLIKIIF